MTTQMDHTTFSLNMTTNIGLCYATHLIFISGNLKHEFLWELHNCIGTLFTPLCSRICLLTLMFLFLSATSGRNIHFYHLCTGSWRKELSICQKSFIFFLTDLGTEWHPGNCSVGLLLV